MNIEIKTRSESIDVEFLSSLIEEKGSAELFDATPSETADIHTKKSFPEFMNMIRRHLIGESETKVMVVKEWESTDQRIFEHYVTSKIKQIPLKQDETYDNISFSLNVTNTSDENMTVYSNCLYASNNKPIGKYFSPLFQLCILHPGCHIKINSIEVEEDHPKGKDYSFKMISGNPSYRSNAEQTEFHMSVSSCPRTPIKYVLNRAYHSLQERVGQMAEALEHMELDSDGVPRISFSGSIQYRPTNTYVMEGESTTIPVVLKYYIENLDNQSSVKVRPTTHPAHRSTNIIVTAKDAYGLMKKAFNQLLGDLKKFGDAVKKMKN